MSLFRNVGVADGLMDFIVLIASSAAGWLRPIK
jgi:hypothetical protein